MNLYSYADAPGIRKYKKKPKKKTAKKKRREEERRNDDLFNALGGV